MYKIHYADLSLPDCVKSGHICFWKKESDSRLQVLTFVSKKNFTMEGQSPSTQFLNQVHVFNIVLPSGQRNKINMILFLVWNYFYHLNFSFTSKGSSIFSLMCGWLVSDSATHCVLKQAELTAMYKDVVTSSADVEWCSSIYEIVSKTRRSLKRMEYKNALQIKQASLPIGC